MDQTNKQNQRDGLIDNIESEMRGTWRRSGVQTQIWGDQISKKNGYLLTCRTLLVRPVFWASCFKSLASGLWLMAK